MKIPKAFANDLAVVRHWDVELGNDANWHYGKICQDHETFLRRLCKFALRFNHWGVFSTEDDLYQEACLRLIRYVRQWDEERGTSLEDYVVYNIGADLSKIPIGETIGKRCPKQPPISTSETMRDGQPRWENPDVVGDRIHSNTGGKSSMLATSAIVTRDTERALAIRRAVENVNKYPMIYHLLLNALVEDGTILGATQLLIKTRKLRASEDARTCARHIEAEFLPKLQEILREELKSEGIDI